MSLVVDDVYSELSMFKKPIKEVIVKGMALQFAADYQEFCIINDLTERSNLHKKIISLLCSDTEVYPLSLVHEAETLVFDSNEEPFLKEVGWCWDAAVFAHAAISLKHHAEISRKHDVNVVVEQLYNIFSIANASIQLTKEELELGEDIDSLAVSEQAFCWLSHTFCSAGAKFPKQTI